MLIFGSFSQNSGDFTCSAIGIGHNQYRVMLAFRDSDNFLNPFAVGFEVFIYFFSSVPEMLLNLLYILTVYKGKVKRNIACRTRKPCKHPEDREEYRERTGVMKQCLCSNLHILLYFNSGLYADVITSVDTYSSVAVIDNYYLSVADNVVFIPDIQVFYIESRN